LEERTLLTVSVASALGVGSTGTDRASAVATDNAGNTYVSGYFSGTVNFNPNGSAVNITSLGTHDAVVAKYAPNDSLLWVDRMGGNLASNAVRLTLDGSGNVYVEGQFQGNGADFGSTLLNSAGGIDAFVTKLDTNGNFQWAKSWGTSNNDFANGIGVDPSGNVYATFGTLASAGYPGLGYTIRKYNPSGASDWSYAIACNQLSSALAADASGNVFLAGTFLGSANFNPNGKAHYVSSGCNGTTIAGFVLELNTNGKFGWVDAFEGQAVGSTKGYSVMTSVALDGSGNIDAGGYYANTVNFNPGRGVNNLTTPGQDPGGFVVQLNHSGGFNWVQAMVPTSATTQEGVSSVATDSSGNIYVLGTGTGGTVTSSNGSQTPVGAGLFVVKFDSAGNFDWDGAVSGTGTAYAGGIAVGANGTVYVDGYYTGTVNFSLDPNNPDDLTSAGGDDIFFLQLTQS